MTETQNEQNVWAPVTPVQEGTDVTAPVAEVAATQPATPEPVVENAEAPVAESPNNENPWFQTDWLAPEAQAAPAAQPVAPEAQAVPAAQSAAPEAQSGTNQAQSENKSTWEQLKDGAKEWLEKVGGAVKWTVAWTWNVASWVVKDVNNGVLPEKTATKLNNFNDKTSQKAQELWGKAKEKLNEAWDKTKWFFSNMWNNFKSGFSSKDAKKVLDEANAPLETPQPAVPEAQAAPAVQPVAPEAQAAPAAQPVAPEAQAAPAAQPVAPEAQAAPAVQPWDVQQPTNLG